MLWTEEELTKVARERLKDKLLVVACNREPYLHVIKEGKIECMRPASGAVTAVDPVIRACGGVWVGHGSGNADKMMVDDDGKIPVPPEDPKYILKRIWLTKEEEEGYYYGFANKAIWPLAHIAYARPIFEKRDWEYYKLVNQYFANAILKEVEGKDAFVWVQDYHLTLVPRLLRDKRKDLIIAHFWHIPWPNSETFGICPWKKEILKGLLANDILGFHIRYHCENFFDTVDKELESKIDRERYSVIYKGHETLIRAFPIGVNFEAISKQAVSQRSAMLIEKVKEEYSLEGKKMLFGVDRFDYTKGIPERLQAIDRFLEKYPEYKKKFVFLQTGPLSRIHIKRYKDLNDQINELAIEINWKHSTDSWSPIILVRKHLSFEEMVAFYRLADICIVSSLHDGMNLIAKEYVAAREGVGGILMLSQFAGASRELHEALIINPYDIDGFADSIKQALEMPKEERQRRMAALRATVRENNIYKWAGKFIMEIDRIKR